MSGSHAHKERHRSDRIGWLRAAVLGANDGIVSVSSLVIGVAAANTERSTILLSGIAGLVAGAMSMAAGEYVSVSSQADTEEADRRQELEELERDPAGELKELTQIYRDRGLELELAHEVAVALTKHDAIGTHLRDELGITEQLAAKPLQAAIASAIAFAVGGALPMLVAMLSQDRTLIASVVVATLLSLVVLGGLSARVGNASVTTAATRVTFWGVMAMAATYAIGWLFGVSV